MHVSSALDVLLRHYENVGDAADAAMHDEHPALEKPCLTEMVGESSAHMIPVTDGSESVMACA